MAKFVDAQFLLALVIHMTNNLDGFFSALSDPTRRAVVERLMSGPAPVSELHAPHDMALPTFLKHIKVLEKASLVRTEKKGRVRTVHIEAAALVEAQDWLMQQRAVWEERFNRFDALVGVLADTCERDEERDHEP